MRDGSQKQLKGSASFDVQTKQVVFTVDDSDSVFLPEVASIIIQ